MIDAAKFGPAGRELIDAMVGELTVGEQVHEYDAREEKLICTAAALADRLARLNECVPEGGEFQTSATGIVRIHPAIPEARATALALAKVLDSVKLPEENAQGRSPAQLRASRAAHARWDRVARREVV